MSDLPVLFAIVTLGLCAVLGILVSYAAVRHALKEIDRMGDRLRTNDPMALAALRHLDRTPEATPENGAGEPPRNLSLETAIGDSGG